ncbi:MAG: hypothetical protein RLZZ142_1915, partial [Verrucomicrobiota bacterium]
SGRYEGNAALEWKEGQPGALLQVEVGCAKAAWEGIGGLAGVRAWGRSDWKLTGPTAQPTLSGEIVVSGGSWAPGTDLRWFWSDAQPRKLSLWEGPEFLKNARLQVRVSAAEGASVGEGEAKGGMKVELQMGGLVSKPEVSGECRLRFRANAAGGGVEVDPLLLRFEAGNPEPSVEVRLKGSVEKGGFEASAVGPLGRPLRQYQAQAPLTPEAVRAVFEEGKSW